MKNVVFCSALAIAAFASFGVHAARVSFTGSVDRILVYSEFNNGDVLVRAGNTLASCASGLWLSAADPGLDRSLSVLVSAKLAASQVTYNVLTDQQWSGSSSTTTCRIESIWLN